MNKSFHKETIFWAILLLMGKWERMWECVPLETNYNTFFRRIQGPLSNAKIF